MPCLHRFDLCVCVCSGSSDWPLLRDKDPSRDPVVLWPAVPLLPHWHGRGQRRLLCPIQHDAQRSQRLWVPDNFFSECVFVRADGFIYLFFLSQPLFSLFQQLHLCWHSSFLSSSFTPLTLSIFSALPALMLFKFLSPLLVYFALSSESMISQKQTHTIFFLEYKLTSPQFTSAHLWGCSLSPFALFSVWIYLVFKLL